MEPKEKLEALFAECESEARKQGWNGDWEPTVGDVRFIEHQFGLVFNRKPYKAEWLCFVGWIGESHCEDYE